MEEVAGSRFVGADDISGRNGEGRRKDRNSVASEAMFRHVLVKPWSWRSHEHLVLGFFK